MRILVVGAGLSGCTIARLLTDRGHDVSVIEKEDHIGGLCITKVNDDGLKYEPFGARTFHTRDIRVKEYISRFDGFNGYVHRKGIIIDNKLFPFPITEHDLDDLDNKEQIFNELRNRPHAVDNTNFKTAAISMFGQTLYGCFVGNYTEKMWGCKPEELGAEMATSRLELRKTRQRECFTDQWQGLPVNGYSYLLENMLRGIPVRLGTQEFEVRNYDVVVSSAPIDGLMDYRFGKIRYRSMRFSYKRDERWEDDDYGTINMPQHPRHIRKCNFSVLHKANSEHNWIQYQEPVEANDDHVPMYPVNTGENKEIFDKYLREVCKTNICPVGRLGLSKYLDMDKAVMHAFEMLPLITTYRSLDRDEKYKTIKQIIGHF